jgi:hypothetical protein
VSNSTSHIIDRYLTRRVGPALIDGSPAGELGLVVAIPAYDETTITAVLSSLFECSPPPCLVEVIVLVNLPSDAETDVRERSRSAAEQAKEWAQQNSREGIAVHIVGPVELPARHAGVGLARKLAMDEGTRRLASAGNGDGVIVCLDADCSVAPNYLAEVVAYFLARPRVGASTIHYEHPLDDDTMGPLITRYELFLRYYRLGLRFAGSAHAFHTVGSAIAVRACAYARQGGMNRRQAGEDFYFMQKLADGEQVGELNSTVVRPAARLSRRVPFGTGRALHDAVLDPESTAFYSPQVFEDLRAFFDGLPCVYRGLPYDEFSGGLAPALRSYLVGVDGEAKLAEIKANVGGESAYVRRAKRWFNGFLAMKYARYCSLQHYPFASPGDALTRLGELLEMDHAARSDDLAAWLIELRELEREG